MERSLIIIHMVEISRLHSLRSFHSKWQYYNHVISPSRSFFLLSSWAKHSVVEGSHVAKHCITTFLHVPHHGILRFGKLPHTPWRQNDILTVEISPLQTLRVFQSKWHTITCHPAFTESEGRETTVVERSLVIIILNKQKRRRGLLFCYRVCFVLIVS